ncbi:MAG: pyruvate formate lyase family protein, partial [Reinekea sp.]|nr:pyruvate formate lyase family protein [Reinekea sp.]
MYKEKAGDSINAQANPWEGFVPGVWNEAIDVRDFIQKNYTPFEGDSSFLAGATTRTKDVWAQVLELMKEEQRLQGPLDFDTDLPSTITSHKPGYIDKNLERIVGLQTDAPLKRGMIPNGGIRMVEASCEAYGRTLDPTVNEIFSKYRKTHNAGVFDGYTPDMLKCRKAGIITGLPDAYGRGRIIGDYRRVALYGTDRLIVDKKAQKTSLDNENMSEQVIRLREELSEQIRALQEMTEMA